MTLSPGAKVQPNRSTLRSPEVLSAACSSMFKERAPTPPRFIGQRTWMSRIGSRPKLCFHQLDDARDSGFGVIRLYEVEVANGSGRSEIRDRAAVDAMGSCDDAA